VRDVPSLGELGFNRATDKLVDKYRKRKIKSVIHFRRIMESYERSEGDARRRAAVLRRIEEFFLDPSLETREAFDGFVVEQKRVQTALAACSTFLDQLKRLKLRYTFDDEERTQLRAALREVRQYCKSLAQALRGSDDPEIPND
jgi:hypothetical protein